MAARSSVNRRLSATFVKCCSGRARSPVVRYGRIVVALLLGYWLMSFLVTHISRLEISLDTTWYDMGLRGIMPTRSYHSYDRTSPDLEFLAQSSECSREQIIFAPRGLAVSQPGGLILDYRGELVWRQPKSDLQTQDLRVQEYRGEKFLTFWVGEEIDSQKKGVWYMLDETYTVRHKIECKGGLSCDMHEFQITEDGTALVTMYDTRPADLSSVGSSASGWLMDCKFQEIDIETGALVFQWSAADHFTVQDSYRTTEGCVNSPAFIYDGCGNYESSSFSYFHLNSVQKDASGNYLISARNTHTISYLNGTTGDVIWNLGGKHNDFLDLSDGTATNFAWQHHARWLEDGSISLFDNAYYSYRDDQTPHSRAMIVDLDTVNRTAELRAEFTHPDHIRSHSQGNAQLLANGNMFVGWGRSSSFTEFSPDGQVLCDAHFGASAFNSFGPVMSYRVARDKWVGRPAEPPSAVFAGGSFFMSWNGATEVKVWVVEYLENGEENRPDKWQILVDIPKDRFETEIRIPSKLQGSLLRAVALDDRAKLLAKSEPVLYHAHGSVPSQKLSKSASIGYVLAVAALGLVLATIIVAGLAMCGSLLRARRQKQQTYGHHTYAFLGNGYNGNPFTDGPMSEEEDVEVVGERKEV